MLQLPGKRPYFLANNTLSGVVFMMKLRTDAC